MIQFSLIYNKIKLRKIARAAEQGAKSLDNASPAMKRIAVFLDRWVQTNFRTEGGKVGGWDPFKYGGRVVTKTKTSSSGRVRKNRKANAQSINSRKHIDASAKLLQETGAMRASYQPFATNFAAGIGSDISYAKKHDEGLGNTPKRRTLPNQEDVKPTVENILNGFIDDVVVKKFKSAFTSN